MLRKKLSLVQKKTTKISQIVEALIQKDILAFYILGGGPYEAQKNSPGLFRGARHLDHP